MMPSRDGASVAEPVAASAEVRVEPGEVAVVVAGVRGAQSPSRRVEGGVEGDRLASVP